MVMIEKKMAPNEEILTESIRNLEFGIFLKILEKFFFFEFGENFGIFYSDQWVGMGH